MRERSSRLGIEFDGFRGIIKRGLEVPLLARNYAAATQGSGPGLGRGGFVVDDACVAVQLCGGLFDGVAGVRIGLGGLGGDDTDGYDRGGYRDGKHLSDLSTHGFLRNLASA